MSIPHPGSYRLTGSDRPPEPGLGVDPVLGRSDHLAVAPDPADQIRSGRHRTPRTAPGHPGVISAAPVARPHRPRGEPLLAGPQEPGQVPQQRDWPSAARRQGCPGDGVRHPLILHCAMTRPISTCLDEPVPELDPSLQQLADAYGIATDYWDWQGRHVEVTRETIVAVLAALDVDASTPEAAAAALEEHHRRPWTRMLPPCLAMREHRRPRSRCTCPTATRSRSGSSWRPAGAADHLRQLENWSPPQEIDGRLVGRGVLRDPRGPAAGLPHAARPLRRAARDDAADHHPGLAGLPGTDGRAAGLGPGRPALQRALPAVLGGRRPDRPGGPRGVVGRGARRRLRAGQPAARRRAGGADGAVAVPADQPPVRQPDLPPAGADPGVRAARRPSSGTRSTSTGSSSRYELARSNRIDRNRSWTAKRKALKVHLRGTADAGPGGLARGLPAAGGPWAHRLRDLGGAGGDGYGPNFSDWPAELQRSRSRRRWPTSRRAHAAPDRLPVLAAVAAGRAAGRRPPGGRCGPG